MGLNRKVWMVLFLLLGIYSVTLLSIELRCGNECVRGYFSDIKTGTDYPLPFTMLYGVNTTLMVVLLTSIALLFLVSIGVRRGIPVYPSQNLFEWFQVIFFIFLACDERFIIHEKIGNTDLFDDVFVILAWGVLELFMLFKAGRLLKQSWRMKGWVMAAALFFGIMVFLDGVFPSRAGELISLEDLSKTWACVCLFVFAWNYCMESISLKMSEELDES